MVIKLDQVVQHIMKKIRHGVNYSDIKKIVKEQNQVFLEITQFVEYSHRTYTHFERMFPIVYEKLRRDDAKAQAYEDTDKGEKVEH